ncbi:MAG TPA: dihydropteroate synthase, partial [Bacteroidales bacterium]|nr:dihydropteroate synthase [Bacteroidales bacterium]
NYTLLRDLRLFEMLDCPIAVGISRKSMVYKPLGLSPDDALTGTTALHVLALLNGASILRVHDVKEAVHTIRLLELYRGAGN